MGFFAEFVAIGSTCARSSMTTRSLKTKEEFEEWKRTWDNGTWVKTDDGKSPYTGK